MKPNNILSRSASCDSDIRSIIHNHPERAVSVAESVHKHEKGDQVKRGGNALFCTLLLTISIMWTLYGNISTFYPPYRKEHHPTITDTMVGIVLAMFEGGVLLMAPLVSLTLQKVGRKNYVLIGCLSTLFASLGFAFSVYIEGDIAFFVVSLIVRFLQGFGDAAASTAMLSIISFEYPDKREKYYGYLEASIGVGLMIGPVVGQLLYNAFGFQKTFFATAGILVIPLTLCIIFIPWRINSLKEEDVMNDIGANKEQEHKKITFLMLITNKRVFMACISSIFAMIFMLFYDTILSDQLILIGVSESVIGYIFALGCLIYAIFCPLVGHLCKYVPKIFLTQFAFLAAFVSLLFFGPSQVFGFQESATLIIIGVSMLGFACAFIFAPLLPEIIDAVQEKEKIGENSELNDRASGMFNSSYAIGCLIAPILGGIFNDHYGYRTTCDIMAFSSLGYAILYFIVIMIPYIIQKIKKQKDLNGSFVQSGLKKSEQYTQYEEVFIRQFHPESRIEISQDEIKVEETVPKFKGRQDSLGVISQENTNDYQEQ